MRIVSKIGVTLFCLASLSACADDAYTPPPVGGGPTGGLEPEQFEPPGPSSDSGSGGCTPDGCGEFELQPEMFGECGSGDNGESVIWDCRGFAIGLYSTIISPTPANPLGEEILVPNYNGDPILGGAPWCVDPAAQQSYGFRTQVCWHSEDIFPDQVDKEALLAAVEQACKVQCEADVWASDWVGVPAQAPGETGGVLQEVHCFITTDTSAVELSTLTEDPRLPDDAPSVTPDNCTWSIDSAVSETEEACGPGCKSAANQALPAQLTTCTADGVGGPRCCEMFSTNVCPYLEAEVTGGSGGPAQHHVSLEGNYTLRLFGSDVLVANPVAAEMRFSLSECGSRYCPIYLAELNIHGEDTTFEVTDGLYKSALNPNARLLRPVIGSWDAQSSSFSFPAGSVAIVAATELAKPVALANATFVPDIKVRTTYRNPTPLTGTITTPRNVTLDSIDFGGVNNKISVEFTAGDFLGQPPGASINVPTQIRCTEPGVAAFNLKSVTHDFDDDLLQEVWHVVGGPSDQPVDRWYFGSSPSVRLPLGTYKLTLRAIDERLGVSHAASSLEVIDSMLCN